MEQVKCDVQFELTLRRTVAAGQCKVIRFGDLGVTMHVVVDEQWLLVIWDRKRNVVSYARPLTLEELASCTCGIKHCNERFGEKTTWDDEPCWFDHHCDCSFCGPQL